MVADREFTVVIEQDLEGWLVGEVIELSSHRTQGERSMSRWSGFAR